MQNNLNHFSYIVEKNFKEITNIFLQSWENKNIHINTAQFYLMTTLKALGFSIIGVRFPYIGKTTKQKEELFDFGLEPWFEFTTNRKPHEKYKNEYQIIKNELIKSNYLDFNPYLNWANDDGNIIRNDIHHLLQKEGISSEYKQWLKTHKRKTNEFSLLIDSFEKENKSKLHFYLDEKKDILIITSKKRHKTKKRYTMTKEEKVKVAKQYEKDLRLFVNFIYNYPTK